MPVPPCTRSSITSAGDFPFEYRLSHLYPVGKRSVCSCLNLCERFVHRRSEGWAIIKVVVPCIDQAF